MIQRRIRPVAALLALALTLVASRPAAAQSAAIEGRIVDEQRAVPGATVVAVDARTGLSRAVVSDSGGLYLLSGLPVGSYDLTASLDGFTAARRSNRLSVDILNLAAREHLLADL